MGLPSGLAVKNPSADAGGTGSIPGSRRACNPVQYSFLENPMDKGTQVENPVWSLTGLAAESLWIILRHSHEWGQSRRCSDYMWGPGSGLLWDLCFPSFQHWLGQVERCTYAQGRLRFNIVLCWLLGRCLFKGSGNRCVGPDSITWWRGTRWSMALFKERCWLC